MLEVDRIHVSYGRVVALRDVSLEVREGEAVGIIGANGAGKSTMLRTIAGVLSPNSGTITFAGRLIVGSAPENIVRMGIVLVPEGRRIFETLTVEENLLIGATSRKDRFAVRQDLVEAYERFPALGDLRGTHAGRLSGGEQQQLAVARALLAKPVCIMLDEPSVGLGPQIIDLIFETLADLKTQGMTVLLVEQESRRTVAFADRTYVLRTGEVALHGTRDELLAMTDLGTAYMGFEPDAV